MYNDSDNVMEAGTGDSREPMAYDPMDGSLNVVRYEEIPAVGSNAGSNAGSDVGSYTQHSDFLDPHEIQVNI